jgi:plasmid stabilization system protein ParE
MSVPVYIRPEALADLEAAAEWYEERVPGLGAEYVRAMRAAITSLAEGAYHHHLRNRRLRMRWLCTRRFPYRIVYRIDDARVTVFAVLHAARHDREWQRRV